MKTLYAPDATIRVIAPTTTKKIAQRLLSGSREVSAALPNRFHTPVALDVLLTLYIAEEDACYLDVIDLEVGRHLSRGALSRWISALVSEGLVECRDRIIALSQSGYDLITTTIENICRQQRVLD